MWSGELIKYLMQHNLIDEYALLIHPIVLGEGHRLFAEGVSANLKPVSSKTTEKGVVVAIYEPSLS